MHRGTGIAIALSLAAAAAGCSSGSSGGSTAAPPTTPLTETYTPTESTATTRTFTPPPPTTGAADLVLASAIRAELIHAQAQVENLPDSAYTGFYKGTAYYALDRDTGTYWAAGSLLPSKHSLRAQVSVQDEGGYLLFDKKPGAQWRVYNVGLEGEPDVTACPVRPPADVLTVWRWKPKSCNPPFH
ncbi:MAG TPA: hypothetical protein VHV76_01755 [Mycobacteriales bacterium]|nr:hypothetical protein [Mycobacteriales bacterium]